MAVCAGWYYHQRIASGVSIVNDHRGARRSGIGTNGPPLSDCFSCRDSAPPCLLSMLGVYTVYCNDRGRGCWKFLFTSSFAPAPLKKNFFFRCGDKVACSYLDSTTFNILFGYLFPYLLLHVNPRSRLILPIGHKILAPLCA